LLPFLHHAYHTFISKHPRPARVLQCTRHGLLRSIVSLMSGYRSVP
jgi:hypothetical protein